MQGLKWFKRQNITVFIWSICWRLFSFVATHQHQLSVNLLARRHAARCQPGELQGGHCTVAQAPTHESLLLVTHAVELPTALFRNTDGFRLIDRGRRKELQGFHSRLVKETYFRAA